MAEAFDFKGNPLFSTRQLAQEYKTAVNWRPIESYFDSGQSTTLNLDRLYGECAVAGGGDLHHQDDLRRTRPACVPDYARHECDEKQLQRSKPA